MSRRSWVQDPETGKLIPKELYVRKGTQQHYIQGDVDAFVSPIDGSVIDDRGKLRDHMSKHGVTDSRDYSPEYVQKRATARVNQMTGNTPEARQDRINLIRRELDK